METNSIGHENKYHLQVTFEDKTDPKNTEKKQRYPPQNPYCISISQQLLALEIKNENNLIKLHLDAITKHSQPIQYAQTALCPRCQFLLYSN